MRLRFSAALLGSALLTSCWSGGVAVEPQPGGASGQASTYQAACPGGALKGEGASSQKSAVELLVQYYVAACPGSTIDYTASGSGAGIKAFYGATVDWAGSDSALRQQEKDGVVETERAAERCDSNPAWNLPMVFGPIALAYNVDGVTDLNLTAEVTARIFNGQITTWNDPAIAEVNPGVELPDTQIAVFFRADESGTTENFTSYLADAGGGTWGYDAAKKWPTSHGEGKEKTAGVADSVAATANSITYLDWGAALERDLATASIDGVPLTAEAASATVAQAEHTGEGNDLRLKINHTPKGEAYPLVAVTYEVVCSAGGSNTELLKDFLRLFTDESSQTLLESLGYASLPDELRSQVIQAVEEIQ